MAGHSHLGEILARINEAGVFWKACATYIEDLTSRNKAIELAVVDNTVAVRALRQAIEHNEETLRQLAAQQTEERQFANAQLIDAQNHLARTVQGVRQQLREYDARSALGRPQERERGN